MNISLETGQPNFIMWLCHPIQIKEKTQLNVIASMFYYISMFTGSNCVGSKAINKVMRCIEKPSININL